MSMQELYEYRKTLSHPFPAPETRASWPPLPLTAQTERAVVYKEDSFRCLLYFI